jgi:RNA polymerase sigma-70 factor (ECF subfamily)
VLRTRTKQQEPDTAELFTAAYREFAGPLTGYLRARGVDDPEGVTQDVFLALYPRLADAHGGMPGIRTLLFTIAHARTVDHHRATARRPLHVEYDPDGDRRTVESAEDQVVAARSSAVAALATLEDDHRDVLALRIVADLPLEETARVMGRSVGAVKQLQRRALIALRGRVAEEVPV